MLKKAASFHTVSPDEQQQRLDNLLLRLIKNVPKSRIYRMIRQGQVRVNKARKPAYYKLQLNDVVRLPPHQTTIVNPPSCAIGWQHLEPHFLFEDEFLLIVNKPSGLMVHGNAQQAGLIECLRHQSDYQYCDLAHRLDRETSGCLVVAKRRSILRQLHQIFRQRQVEKRYYCLVHGEWKSRPRVDLPLERYLLENGERRVRVAQSTAATRALTRFRRLDYQNDTSLLDVRLETGKTHQIRVHCQAVGHPIVQDQKYGDSSADHRLNQPAKRLALHAYRIAFTHPITNKRIQVSDRLCRSVADFQKLLLER